ncbi:MAG: HAMP domain-containing histidine kinase [Gammaproteobacteria bacterium]|nr:HAMP domain-containing histidine kinase [Gammaproteobacteria bacterium]
MLDTSRFLSASRQNLLRLSWIRVLVLCSQSGTLVAVYFSELLTLPWAPLLLLIVAAACIYSLTVLRLRLRWPVTEFEFAIQLGFDLLLHSLLLYYTGGSTNPFVAYYLVPLTIAAATLPWIYSLVLSGLALTGYTALLIWYEPLHIDGQQYSALLISMHLFGMWLNFALSAAFITFFVSRMAQAVRDQKEQQAGHREEALRDQQLLAIASQAAGAAHELGTPLSTMSVLLGELRQEYSDQHSLQDDLALLQEQVRLCKGTLQSLVLAAEADRRQQVQEQSLLEWFEDCINRWHLMRPEATYAYEYSGTGRMPAIRPPAELGQSLLNLLNNATDACADDLTIHLGWDRQWVCISIRDQGAGVPLHVAEQLGKPFITTKGKGLGLGLFLSQASVTRVGGSVKLYNCEGGGTLTELCLPRQSNLFS